MYFDVSIMLLTAPYNCVLCSDVRKQMLCRYQLCRAANLQASFGNAIPRMLVPLVSPHRRNFQDALFHVHASYRASSLSLCKLYLFLPSPSGCSATSLVSSNTSVMMISLTMTFAHCHRRMGPQLKDFILHCLPKRTHEPRSQTFAAVANLPYCGEPQDSF